MSWFLSSAICFSCFYCESQTVLQFLQLQSLFKCAASGLGFSIDYVHITLDSDSGPASPYWSPAQSSHGPWSTSKVPTYPPFHFCHQFALVKLSSALGMIIFFPTESMWDMIMAIDCKTFHLLSMSIFPCEDPDNSSVQLVEVNKPSWAPEDSCNATKETKFDIIAETGHQKVS